MDTIKTVAVLVGSHGHWNEFLRSQPAIDKVVSSISEAYDTTNSIKYLALQLNYPSLHKLRGCRNLIAYYETPSFDHKLRETYGKELGEVGFKILDECRALIKRRVDAQSALRKHNKAIKEFSLSLDTPVEMNTIAWRSIGRHTHTGKVNINYTFTKEEPTVKKLTILFDNGKPHEVKNIKETNALEVVPSDKPNQTYLKYSLKEPTEIGEGIYQEANFAVDTSCIAAIHVLKSDNTHEIKQFKSCGKVNVELFKSNT